MVLKPKKQALNSLLLEDFGGSLAYSWSRQNASAGRKDAKVYTTLTGTLEHLHSLLEPLDDSEYGNKNDAGYITPAMVLRTNPAKESRIEPGMNHRCDASVHSSSIVTLDIDDATPEDFKADLRTVRRSRDALTLYTTASHTDDAPRYRIVAVVDAPLFGDDIVKARYGLVAMLFDGRKLDRASFTLSQAMYRPYTNSEVFHSKGIRLFDAAELVAECPEGVRISEGSRNTTLSDEEAAKVGSYREWMEAACFELEGAFNGPNLLLAPTPDHAYDAGYQTDAKLGDFQFCPPRDGFGAPNVTLVHDSDKVAVEDMSGREKMAYMVKAVGMPDWLENDLYRTLGWSASNIACNDDDLADEPEAPKREIKSLPVVPGWLHTDSTWMYTARTGSFKTFQILNMMAASAAGHPFGGLDTVEAHHFLIDAEGGSRTNDRIEALERQYGKKLDKLHVIPYGEKGIDVVSPEGVKRIIDAINEICGAEPCGIVAFDTLNRTFARKTGFKSASDGEDGMGGVVTTLKHIQKYTGGAVGVIAHPTKSAADNTAAGNMALQNGVDYALYSERNGKTFEINLWHEKAKHVEEISAPGRRFVATKIELRDNEHKPTREQISLFAPVPGLEVSGVEVSDKISTLFIAPISYEPFKSEAAEEGRKAVKKTRVLSPGQQWTYSLIEENDPLTASEIKGAHGKDTSAPKPPYGGVQTWINQLVKAGYVHEKVDERGVKDNTYHIDTRMRPPVPVDEDDLSDD